MLLAGADRCDLGPEVSHGALRQAIGRVHGLDPARIVCGVGSDEVLTFLCQAYAGPGDEVIHTEHGFAMYRISALAAGATPVEVPERARVVDVDAILAAVTERTRLVFIANPANPTGTMIPLEEAARLAAGLPESCLLVLDGAYAEYAAGYDGGAALVSEFGNVVMTRTFSKLYGLGGLRVGWGYAEEEIIGVLNRVRGPFNLSGPALAAAEAAVTDRGFAERTVAENARLRARMVAELRTMGLGCDESHANFVLVRFAGPEAALRDATRRLAEAAGVDVTDLARDACLDFDELRALARDPGVTLGAHTLSHPMLAKADAAGARREIVESKAALEAEIGEAVRHFAYPVGDPGSAGPREFEIAREAGFETAVTTRPGHLFSAHARHLHALPRVSVNGLHQSAGALRALLSGLPLLAWNRGRRIAVG